ncbi:hypothetical protein COU62_04230 [Candidatus Pacearchaeota archaeon CG10_big_fil_rev_8_21_14_0_10_35_219]|nr:hypothetical protein [Candidatus Pacearchaeota archaeon]PIO07318.1 MAG: hypothetical protein COU62_04230 [Candidatus Pacearchaeota archaeon CG10_big_fil_rev_8_21_14_0_10_35_219]PIY81368.1 MAG: hypothetical protein COY79_03775 [Candidatus Pacearchaeota archaeon CG_4_10_14_0_8_um_filter_35_169]PJB94532.1 MAG: hypothetical protein CO081_00565 [Candidatus Pacearchaeota archaeon CG_4_9_14_0_8_um_filter_35_24]
MILVFGRFKKRLFVGFIAAYVNLARTLKEITEKERGLEAGPSPMDLALTVREDLEKYREIPGEIRRMVSERVRSSDDYDVEVEGAIEN